MPSPDAAMATQVGWGCVVLPREPNVAELVNIPANALMKIFSIW